MDDYEIEKRREKARRSSIFKNEEVLKVDHLDWRKTKICGIHLVLANKLVELLPEGVEREEIIQMVDTAYNMAKRMATKIDEYRFGVPYPKSSFHSTPSIDIAMTAAKRPDVIERTLVSIKKYIDYRPLRLVVDIAHVGDEKVTQEETLELIDREFNIPTHGLTVTPRVLYFSLQAEAVKWTWKESTSGFMLQWEDDWVLRRKLNINILLNIMKKYPTMGMLYLDRYKKSVLDYQGYQGRFKKKADNLYIRLKGKSLGGPPALLRRSYINDVIPLIQDTICLDTISPGKEAQELLKNYATGVYIGEDRKGNLVEDIGKQWRQDNNLIMVKKTKVGVQWKKNH